MRQADKVLDYILAHGSITSWEAIQELHITRLSAVIKRLRDCGFDIMTIRHNAFKNGEWMSWGEYVLNEPLPVGWETAHKGIEAPASP